MNSLQNHLVEGQTLRVIGFTGDPTLKRRLFSLGLRRGACFQIIHVSGNHRVVVALGLGQIALGREALISLEVEKTRNLAS